MNVVLIVVMLLFAFGVYKVAKSLLSLLISVAFVLIVSGIGLLLYVELEGYDFYNESQSLESVKVSHIETIELAKTVHNDMYEVKFIDDSKTYKLDNRTLYWSILMDRQDKEFFDHISDDGKFKKYPNFTEISSQNLFQMMKLSMIQAFGSLVDEINNGYDDNESNTKKVDETKAADESEEPPEAILAD